MKLLITCEHGGNRVPSRYSPLFRRHRAALESHRGYDPGALAVARDFAAAFDAELLFSTTSRLVVELNRSPRHPRLWSEATRGLGHDERARLMERHYFPYRTAVEKAVREAAADAQGVLHVSCHSFTPRLAGVERRADIGLLYDPGRRGENAFCKAWQRALRSLAPELVVRRNYPYRGYDDGLTTHLRKRFPGACDLGIELEVNQKDPLGDPQRWRAMRRLLVASLKRALTNGGT